MTTELEKIVEERHILLKKKSQLISSLYKINEMLVEIDRYIEKNCVHKRVACGTDGHRTEWVCEICGL